MRCSSLDVLYEMRQSQTVIRGWRLIFQNLTNWLCCLNIRIYKGNGFSLFKRRNKPSKMSNWIMLNPNNEHSLISKYCIISLPNRQCLKCDTNICHTMRVMFSFYFYQNFTIVSFPIYSTFHSKLLWLCISIMFAINNNQMYKELL